MATPREVTFELMGFEKQLFVSSEVKKVRIPVMLAPFLDGVWGIEFEEDPDGIWRVSTVMRNKCLHQLYAEGLQKTYASEIGKLMQLLAQIKVSHPHLVPDEICRVEKEVGP